MNERLAAHPRNGYYAFNLAFIDGHVATVNDKLLAQGKVAWPEPNGPVPPAGQTGENLTGLDDVIDVLETEADGRDPAVSVGDPTPVVLTSAVTLTGPQGPGYSTNPPTSWILRLQATATSAPWNKATFASGKTYHPLVPWQ